MGKLSSPKNIISKLFDALRGAFEWIAYIYRLVWGFLKTRVPFVRALIERHSQNPATIFIDLSVVIIGFYVLFGLTGYVLIYPKKSESRFTENIASLYPLPAAKVGSSYVWSHDFLERLRFLRTFNNQAPQEATAKLPTDQELRQRVLEGLIENEVILLEAKKRGIRVTEEELQKAFERQGEVKEVKKKIKELYGMDLDDFKEVIAEQVLREKLKNSVLVKVRVRHVLVTNSATAGIVKRELENGKPFEEVTKEYSQDSKTRENGGDLGIWHKGDLVSQISPGFEDTAFTLAINSISDPIQSPFGFHVLQVTERSGDNTQTYEEWYKETLSKYKVKRYVRL